MRGSKRANFAEFNFADRQISKVSRNLISRISYFQEKNICFLSQKTYEIEPMTVKKKEKKKKSNFAEFNFADEPY